jgi:hypothetical protein
MEIIPTAKTTKKQSNQGFKLGQSDNPSGRPNGSRNKTTLALEALLGGEGKGPSPEKL